jgi:hypothetical protein
MITFLYDMYDSHNLVIRPKCMFIIMYFGRIFSFYYNF